MLKIKWILIALVVMVALVQYFVLSGGVASKIDQHRKHHHHHHHHHKHHDGDDTVDGRHSHIEDVAKGKGNADQAGAGERSSKKPEPASPKKKHLEVHNEASILPQPQFITRDAKTQSGKTNDMIMRLQGKLMIAADGSKELDQFVKEFVDPSTGGSNEVLEDWIALSPEYFSPVELLDCDTRMGEQCDIIVREEGVTPQSEIEEADDLEAAGDNVLANELRAKRKQRQERRKANQFGTKGDANSNYPKIEEEGYSLEILPEGVVITLSKGTKLRNAARVGEEVEEEGRAAAAADEAAEAAGDAEGDKKQKVGGKKKGGGPANGDKEAEEQETTRLRSYDWPHPRSQFAGLQHALHSLFHLALTSVHPHTQNFGVVPCVTVHSDNPKSIWRGIHVDTARHFFELPTLKKVVQRMARLKMNLLHMHLSDDQGWRLESQIFPSLHEVGGKRGPALNGIHLKKHNGTAYPEPKYFSQAEIHELTEYAAVRNVRVIPELDLPAHAAAVITALNAEAKKLEQKKLEKKQEEEKDKKPTKLEALISKLDLTKFGYTAKKGEGNADCRELTKHQAAKTGAPNCMGGSFGIVYPSENAFKILKLLMGELCSTFKEAPFIHVGGDQAEFLRAKGWSRESLKAEDVKPFDSVPAEYGIDWTVANEKNYEKQLGKVQGFLNDRIINEIVKNPKACVSSYGLDAEGNVEDVNDDPNGDADGDELAGDDARANFDLVSTVHPKERQAVVWDETYLMLDEGYYPPKGTHVMLWRYDGMAVLEQKEQKRYDKWSKSKEGLRPGAVFDRLPVIFTPKMRLYFDYVQYYPYKENRFSRQQVPAKWMGYHALKLKRVFRTHRLTQPGKVNTKLLNVVGYQACLWSELMFSEEHLMYQLVPRIYAIADVAWSTRNDPENQQNAKEAKNEDDAKEGQDAPTGWDLAVPDGATMGDQFRMFEAQVRRITEYDVV